MGTIYLLHLRQQLQSLRFQVGLVVIVAFFAVNGMVYSWKIDGLRDEVATLDASHARYVERVETVADAVGHWYGILNHPLWTEFITEGGVAWFDDTSYVSPHSGRGLPTSNKSISLNFNIEPFEVIDWTFIGRLVMPFICLVVGYDAISGERENGTLRQVLANAISRGDFLFAKFLALWSSLLVPVVVGGLLALVILSLHDAVSLDAHVVVATLFYFAGTAVLIAFVLLLGLGVSAIVSSSATALVVLMLAWAGLSVVVPQISYLIGINAVEAPRWWAREDRVSPEDIEEELAQEGITLRGREFGKVDDYAAERRFARRMNDAEARLMWQRRKAAFDDVIRQYELISTISLLSPGHSYTNSVEAMLGTGVTRYWHFMERVRDYGRLLRDFLRARDAADSDSPHVLFLPDYMSLEGIDYRNIPRFFHDHPPFADGITRGLVPILALLLSTVLAFFFALWAVNRMEIT